jgi:hypothetical protein
MRKVIFALVVALLLTMLLPAYAQEELPTLDNLPVGEWSRIVPGGDTTCGLGGEYSFFVYPNEGDGLIIYFQGGGACWSGENCAADYVSMLGSGLYKQTVEEGESAAFAAGIFDFANAENPVGNYSAVVVPYCTADVHTGSITHEYTDGAGNTYTFAYNGVANSRAVLNWTFENFTEPAQIFLTGGSAGAYGSIFHADAVLSHYDGVRVVQLGDAGVGVVTRDWEGLAEWGTFDEIPDLEALEGLNLTPANFNTELYRATALAYPDNFFSQYTNWTDEVQIGFFFLQGGGATPQEAGGNWVTGARSRMTGLNSSLPNYANFVIGGGQHTILSLPEFYTYASNGVRVRDWVADMLAGEDVPDVLCNNCNAPEIVEPAMP